MNDAIPVFMERFLELLRSDPELHAAAVEILKAHAESERAKAAWYGRRRV